MLTEESFCTWMKKFGEWEAGLPDKEKLAKAAAEKVSYRGALVSTNMLPVIKRCCKMTPGALVLLKDSCFLSSCLFHVHGRPCGTREGATQGRRRSHLGPVTLLFVWVLQWVFGRS